MDAIEKSALLKLFNRGGYVLNFSTNDFDIFTAESIGLPLCQTYNRSKGASLTAYAAEANEQNVVKLLSDLLKYYEIHFVGTIAESTENHVLYEKCRAIMDKTESNTVQIEVPAITCVNREYIKDLSLRAMQDVEATNFDSAITKSRTLLEEVFCYVIEKKGDMPSDSGDIGRLYNQVKQLYHMHQDKELDKRINMLLSGLEKILTSISQMRNEASDAHGVGARRINIEEYHARLFVNSAMTMADFVLSVGEHSKRDLK